MKILVKVISNKNRTFYVRHIPSVTFHYFTLFSDDFSKMVGRRLSLIKSSRVINPTSMLIYSTASSFCGLPEKIPALLAIK